LCHISAGLNLLFSGSFASSRSHLEEALALYDPNAHGSLVRQAHFRSELGARALLGTDLICLGFPDQGLAHIKAAVSGGRSVGHTQTVFSTSHFGAPLISLIGDNAAVGEWASQLVAAAADVGYRLCVAQGTVYQGWAKGQTSGCVGGDITVTQRVERVPHPDAPVHALLSRPPRQRM
jgi:hypothetical protein